MMRTIVTPTLRRFLLTAAIVGAFIWSVIEFFGADPAELLRFLLMGVLVLVLLIAAALLATLGWRLLRRLSRR